MPSWISRWLPLILAESSCVGNAHCGMLRCGGQALKALSAKRIMKKVRGGRGARISFTDHFKAIGLNVGGKIGIARHGEHLVVGMFFGIGLLHLNEVAIGLASLYETNIAIDGPAGLKEHPKALARSLNIHYLDTGAMYRAVAYTAVSAGINVKDEQAGCAAA